MPTLVLPDPSLVVLVGPAGAGKTTLAGRSFAADEVLGSDAMRAIVSGDEADQSATRPAFGILHRRLVQRLAAARLTVVDATNVEIHARRSLLRRARAAGVPAIAIVLDLPPRVVLERNLGRAGRVVESTIVRAHLALLRRAVDGGVLEREGFDRVYRIADPAELDSVEIVRVPTPPRPLAVSDRPSRAAASTGRRSPRAPAAPRRCRPPRRSGPTS